MSDRLPGPLAEPTPLPAAERASATPYARERGGRAYAATNSAAVSGKAAPASLQGVQAWLLQAITGPQASDPRGIVRGQPRMAAAERVHIYRHAYRARLVECLRDDYPVLAQSAGEAMFATLCHAYIDQYPSRSPNLNRFGRHMASVCAGANELAARVFMSELAALEWALVEVTHAPTASLGLEELQRVPPEAWARARLVPSAALQILHFTHPVNAYYQHCRTHDVLPDIPAPQPTATAIYRRGVSLWRMDLTPAMTRVLQALVARATIAEALTQIGVDETDPEALAEAERSVMTWFREWVVGGFFSAIVAEP